MINAAVGEMALEINGKSFKLRPSFACIAMIEHMLGGKSVFTIARRAGDKDNSMLASDVVAILYGGLLASLAPGEKPPMEKVELEQAIFAGRIQNFMPLAATFFAKLLQGNPEDPPKKNESEPEATQPQSTETTT